MCVTCKKSSLSLRFLRKSTSSYVWKKSDKSRFTLFELDKFSLLNRLFIALLSRVCYGTNIRELTLFGKFNFFVSDIFFLQQYSPGFLPFFYSWFFFFTLLPLLFFKLPFIFLLFFYIPAFMIKIIHYTIYLSCQLAIASDRQWKKNYYRLSHPTSAWAEISNYTKYRFDCKWIWMLPCFFFPQHQFLFFFLVLLILLQLCWFSSPSFFYSNSLL